MITKSSIRVFESEGYSVLIKDSSVYIKSNQLATGISLVAFILLLFSIPITLITLNGGYALFASILSFYPGYKLLKETEIPNSITINNTENTLTYYKMYGAFSKSFYKSEIKKLLISSVDETQDANAFKDGVIKTTYYIDLETKDKTFSILRFQHSELDDIQLILKELKASVGIEYINANVAA